MKAYKSIKIQLSEIIKPSRNLLFKAHITISVIFVVLSTNCNKNISTPHAYKNEINHILDSWHIAAAKANYKEYFKYFHEDAIFIGTDATENWQIDSFKTWSKPYFDRGMAWNFKAIERNIFINKEKNMVWFDELLLTQMKICRGSGVLVKKDKNWHIIHYVLSMTIPNDLVDQVVPLKASIEDSLVNNKILVR